MGNTKSALLVGVGGQGAILTAKVLVNGLMKAGYHVFFQASSPAVRSVRLRAVFPGCARIRAFLRNRAVRFPQLRVFFLVRVVRRVKILLRIVPAIRSVLVFFLYRTQLFFVFLPVLPFKGLEYHGNAPLPGLLQHRCEQPAEDAGAPAVPPHGQSLQDVDRFGAQG